MYIITISSEWFEDVRIPTSLCEAGGHGCVYISSLWFKEDAWAHRSNGPKDGPNLTDQSSKQPCQMTVQIFDFLREKRGTQSRGSSSHGPWLSYIKICWLDWIGFACDVLWFFFNSDSSCFLWGVHRKAQLLFVPGSKYLWGMIPISIITSK